jgi:DNA-binding LytR/AlgR family response regulator
MEILIIEDEQNAIERLEKLIQEIAPEKKIIGKCQSIEQTIEWLNQNEYPDLILSDVQLSDGLSFDIFKQLKMKVPVIFISAYDTYALDAFKAEGLHYLLKPVKRDELKEAIARYEKKSHVTKLNSGDAISQDPLSNIFSRQYQERFIINVGAQIKLVHDNEIAYVFTESKVVYLVTFSNQKFVLDVTLENFEKTLNPKLFYRINRQFIVNLKSIAKMTPATKQRIALTLSPGSSYETITSFERTPQFKKWLLGEV